MKRRKFMKKTAAGSILFPSLLLKGCAARKDYDILITGGEVYDGLGKDVADMDEHLEECLETDNDTLDEYFVENKVDTKFYFGQPDIDETIISVYIYEE